MDNNDLPAKILVPLSSKNDWDDYLLHLADNALILGQRNAEWCAHGPVLEQDIAITNISLDLIGQARNLYQYAAQLRNESSQLFASEGLQQTTTTIADNWTEDKLAFLRNEGEFKNCLMVELPVGDWAQTILRQFFFSAYQLQLYEILQSCGDEQLAAIAAKAVKEVSYHLRWSSEWVIRLGDGTEESSQRIKQAVRVLWPYTGELFSPSKYEIALATVEERLNPSLLKYHWEQKVAEIFVEATINYPANVWMQSGGKEGKHTEHLGYILAEMQYLQRMYPDSQW